MKNRRCNIAFVYLSGKEVLNVGFGKHAAARCNRVVVFSLFGKSVHILNFNVEEGSHLLNKRTCSACAVSVHTDVGIFARTEKNHFGILAANVNEGFYIWVFFFYHVGGSNYLLNKFDIVALRYAHTCRACDGSGNGDVAELLLCLLESLGNSLIYVSVVLLVRSKHNFTQ